MWSFREETLPGGRGLRVRVARDGEAASCAEFHAGLRADAALRAALTAVLADAPFSALRWETPAVTTETRSRPFEFVLLDSPELEVAADATAFEEYFADEREPVVAFSNLGGDAVLVAPRPLAPLSAYAHLAAFAREAPESQRQALWKRVGEALEERVDVRPVWLSTAGAGVAWLHVRLDDRPKYYGYAPYRRP